MKVSKSRRVVVSAAASVVALTGAALVVTSATRSDTAASSTTSPPMSGSAPMSGSGLALTPRRTSPPLGARASKQAIDMPAPMSVQIPRLHVDARVEVEPVVNNTLTIPTDVHEVALYSGGGLLDDSRGTVLLAGHVNYVGQGPGAFTSIQQLASGDIVMTRGRSEQVQRWRVRSERLYLKQALPQTIFTAVGARRLVLVTCGGLIQALHGSG